MGKDNWTDGIQDDMEIDGVSAVQEMGDGSFAKDWWQGMVDHPVQLRVV